MARVLQLETSQLVGKHRVVIAEIQYLESIIELETSQLVRKHIE